MNTPTPIAVIGIGCRFPGGAHDLSSFWKLLAEGRNVWSDVPDNRFSWSSFSRNDRSHGWDSGYRHRGGHFLRQDVSCFDAGFFSISPAEAKAMDPQQRIQLEVAYESLENAGLPLETVKASDTSVHVATFTHDYENMTYKDGMSFPKYSMTGLGQALVSNRISYAFDLKGPSITLDTGCSGSLVALHLACQGLRTGESSMALVGGTNLILSPDSMIPMDLLHFLNRDGRSFSFDSRGSGYGRGEGVAMVVLKRLDDALKANDPIRAVIRNTAVGQDGTTSGITLPNGAAQQHLIDSLYEASGLKPRETGYVEAHGTGTRAGDLIELEAISKIFSRDRLAENLLYVGSVKANIGHLESTSGLAGLIKGILVLEKGQIPAIANLETIKSDLEPFLANIKLNRELVSWPSNAIRRASVNSFGYGGTNAHAIIESYQCYQNSLGQSNISYHTEFEQSVVHGSSYGSPSVQISQRNAESLIFGLEPHHTHLYDGQLSRQDTGLQIQEKVAIIVTITAKSRASLLAALGKLRDWSMKPDALNVSVAALARTLTSRRTFLPWRYTFLASTRKELLSSLESTALRATQIAKTNRIVFVFTGQGAQWNGMTKELFAASAVFRESLIQSDTILRGIGSSWSLLEELSKGEKESRIDESEIGQPASIALQIALVDLLRDLNIVPNAVLGHSSGEVTAAYAAYALTHESAMEVSYYRSFLGQRCKMLLKVDGAMLAVSASEEEIRPYLSRLSSCHANRVVVACSNSPSSTVVSGDKDAIIELQESLKAFAISAKRVNVDTAYHSQHMQAVAETYLDNLRQLKFASIAHDIVFYSSVTASKKSANFGAEYWVSNLVSKVRFHEALQEVLAHITKDFSETSSHGCCAFLEVGPHNVLTGPIKQTITSLGLTTTPLITCLPTFTRNRGTLRPFLQSVATLFEQGCEVNLNKANFLNGPNGKLPVVTDLPPYCWDHSASYWHESNLSQRHRFRPHPYHDLLGLRHPGDILVEPTWSQTLSLETLPWLRDHCVEGRVVFPATGYVAMAIEAKAQITLDRFDTRNIREFLIKDLEFVSFLEIPEVPGSVHVHTSLRSSISLRDRSATAWEEFRVSSIGANGVSVEHCRCFIKVVLTNPADEDNEIGDIDTPFAHNQWKEYRSTLDSQIAQEFHPKVIYEEMRLSGNHWGPSFALLHDFLVLDSRAAGSVNISDLTNSASESVGTSYVIHPTTLDSLLQTSLILSALSNDHGPVVPVGIEELRISASIVRTPGARLAFVTNAVSDGPSSRAFHTSAFSGTSDSIARPCVSVRNGRLKGSNVMARPERLSAWEAQDRLQQLEWSEDVDLCSPIKSYATPTDSALYQEPADRANILDDLAQSYVDTCLKQVKKTEVTWQHSKFYDWMEAFQQAQHINHPQKADCNSRNEMLSLGIEGEALSRVGSSLTNIVTGKSDPLALLLQDDILSRLYVEDSASQQCFSYLTEYVRRFHFKYPHMRVLEIGAGTGGATLPALQALGDHSDTLEYYDFTDVSPGFFETARSKFQRWKNILRYKILDIERDSVQQGFPESSYDLVIAYNAMHVTRSVDEALRHTRRLLKPGGRLVLIEITRPSPYLSVIYGSLLGWFSDRSDGRMQTPILNVDQWQDRLLQASFGEIDTSVKDYEGSAHKMTMIVSKAVQDDAVLPLIPYSIRVSVHPRSPLDPDRLLRGINDTSQLHQSALLLDNFAVGSVDQSADDNVLYILVDHSEYPGSTPLNLEISILGLPQKCRNILRIFTDDFTEVDTPTSPPELRALHRIELSLSTHLATLYICDATNDNSESIGSAVSRVADASFGTPIPNYSIEAEYLLLNDKIFIRRLKFDQRCYQWLQERSDTQCSLQDFNQPDRPLRMCLDSLQEGSSIKFVDDTTLHKPLRSDEIEIHAEAYGINRLAQGHRKPQESSPGVIGECAGIVTAVGAEAMRYYRIGDRVCGLGEPPFSNRMRLQIASAAHLPLSIPFAIGAAIPVSFVTAYYVLVEYANLREGQSVLVRAASDGIGQALLKIAKYNGAEIIATAETAEQRHVLMISLGLTADRVLPERSNTMQPSIEAITHGNGVNVVVDLSSVSSLEESYSCITSFGKIIEIGKLADVSSPSAGTRRSNKNVTYAHFELLALVTFVSRNSPNTLQKVVSLVESHVLQLSHTIVSKDFTKINEAFDSVMSGRVIGKSVLEITPSTVVMAAPKRSRILNLCSHSTYAVASDSECVGFDICHLLIERGARHVVLFLVGGFEQERIQLLRSRFHRHDVHLDVIGCDVGSDFEAQIETNISDQVPVKGYIRAKANSKIARRTGGGTEGFSSNLFELNYIRLLARALKKHKLDFRVDLLSTSMLSARGGDFGSPPRNFISKPTVKGLASSTTFTTLIVGPIEKNRFDRDFRTAHAEQSPPLRQLLPMKAAEVLVLLEYAMSRASGNHELVCGLSREVLSTADGVDARHDAVFSHLQRRMPVTKKGQEPGPAPKEEKLADATTPAEARRIVLAAVRRKLSTFVAIESDMIDPSIAIEELGLDSLVTFTFRSWIFQNFRADLAAQTISEASSIYALAENIIGCGTSQHSLHYQQRVSLEDGFKNNKSSLVKELDHDADKLGTKSASSSDLPRQPLPALADTVQRFLESAKPFCPRNELEVTNQAVECFVDPQGIGPKLQERLFQREADPRIDNWLSDVYLSRRYLRARTPLVPCQTYFGTHPAGEHPHRQAERAAIVSTAALKFKAVLESGQLEPQFLSGHILDPSSYQWLFNTCREPHPEEDQICTYPQSNYIVVFRRGHAYKVSLLDGAAYDSFETLEAAFESILRLPSEEKSGIGVLTTGGRDSWAELRKHLHSIKDQNASSIQDLDAAAFVVCLDETEPDSPKQRCAQFLFADGSNRWYDKTLQFVVCENGVSASICEHSLLDGISIEPLHTYINEAITSYNRTDKGPAGHVAQEKNYSLQELPLCGDSITDAAIEQCRKTLQESTQGYSFASLEIAQLSESLLRKWKCPVQSGIQLAIQLASRWFFGYNPPALETVSMARYRKGRVEVNHIIQPAMKDFLAAACDSSLSTGALKPLLYEAAKSHARSLTRASNGRGFSRHLLAMEWMLQEGEEVPSLFKDPVYLRMKPGKVMTSCFTTGWQEGGFVYPVPESILVYYEVEEERIRFSLFGHGVEAKVFRDLLGTAAERVRKILTHG